MLDKDATLKAIESLRSFYNQLELAITIEEDMITKRSLKLAKTQIKNATSRLLSIAKDKKWI